MRGPQAWMVGLVGTALLLPGCIGGSAGDPPAADDGVSVITDPRDTAYLADATPGSHVHDYWDGRTEVVVLQDEGGFWSQCSGACEDGMDAAWARPAEGVIVPQGTRWVNGTFGFTPHAENDATVYELWAKTAADGETRFVAQVQPGEPWSIETVNEQDDPPHYVLSLWEFEVVGKRASDGVVFRGDYAWDVKAVRGHPLVAFPPHPDRWGGQDELPLLDAGGSATVIYQTPTGWTCYGGPAGPCPGVHGLPDGVVVPHDADHVEVRLASSLPTLGLEYHGADTWAFERVEGRLEGTEHVFAIPLAGTLGDSPYAAQSLWEFRVVITPPAGDVAAWSGTYTLTATAHRTA